MPLVKQLVNEEDLLKQFQSIESTSEQSFQQKRPYISSSMCQRQIALNGMMQTRDVYRSPAMKYYAAIGNAIETIIVNNYEIAGNLLIHSWKLPKELFPDGIDLGGKIDMIIQYRGTPVLIDVKTVGVVDASSYINISPEELRELELGNDITIIADDNRPKATVSKKIKEAYQSQLQLYSAITGLDEIFLLSASRRVQDSFTSGGHMSAVFNRIEIQNEILKRRIAILIFGIMARDLKLKPTKLATLKKSHCSDAFCSFVDHCWNGAPLEENFDEMSLDQERVLKNEALSIAETYISQRSSRRDITMELIQKEQVRRQQINQELAFVKKDKIEPLTQKFGLYPLGYRTKNEMVNDRNNKNKFFQEFDVILKTKLGWNVIYRKLRIELPLNNQVIKCSNGQRYSALNGREVGTSTPDFIYRIDDVAEDGLTYLEKYNIQQSLTSNRLTNDASDDIINLSSNGITS